MNKINTFRDFKACARKLIDTGNSIYNDSVKS
jgi:protease II